MGRFVERDGKPHWVEILRISHMVVVMFALFKGPSDSVNLLSALVLLFAYPS